MTKQADLKKRVRDRMAKTGESYSAARRQLRAAASGMSVAPTSDRMAAALHVSNGDATDLPGTGLAPRVLYWRYTLHEGPVPAVPAGQLRRIRAEFLTAAAADDRGEGDDLFAERDRLLEAARDGEYVLWFEADLYDQLQIIQILARLTELEVPAERVTLICIGEHAGVARFGGLGELTTDQLRALPATDACARITPAAMQLAGRAWDAFRAPVPDGLAAIAASRSTELRFLGEAFDRLSREYPATRDGLSLTERRVLAAVADGGADAGAAFTRAGARETRPYLGDTWCYAAIDRMARARVPLLDPTPADRPVRRTTALRLSETGARVLSGDADHVTLNGIDRWIGGVHLQGQNPRWRWNDGTETITDVSAMR